jgi:hypothetical protein
VALDVRGVDDGQPAGLQAAREPSMERREGRPRRALVGGVSGDRGPQLIRAEDLVRCEVAGGERRLSGTGCADERDEGWIREDERGHAGVQSARRRDSQPPVSARRTS